MTFQPVSNRASFPEMEDKVLQFWKDHDIFKKSVNSREGGPVFTLYEGPPTANGTPGVHHVLGRVFKDVIPRFKTMQGYYAPRKAGWDTHGLPVELGIEQELGLHSKREIEDYGIAEFNAKCRESVFRYVKEWETLSDRIAFWVDMDDPYVTFANDYIESGWWIFKQLWDKDLIYKDYKVTPHCPRCVTSLSSHEVALGYREDTPDPSVHVKLRIVDSEEARSALPSLDVPTSLLAWTTTPWTLPANVALAVAEEARYVVVEGSFNSGRRERLILAEALADAIIEEPYEVVATVTGKELVGITYEPLFTFVTPDKPAYRVISADFVSLNDGTGIVHIAPAYGAEDLEVGRAEGLPIVHSVDLDGSVRDFPDIPYAGKFFKEADPPIMEDLSRRGLLYRSGEIKHTYPFCWRCDSPLLYYAKESWYIRTTALKDRLIQANQEIDWHPEHIREGRFGEWLQNNVDWALSRERFWGTPIPVWVCDNCGHQTAIGSTNELQDQKQLQGYAGEMDLHRPFLDEVTFACPECEGRMARVPEVMDAWYDSGAMPVAQWHYPFENADLFDRHSPADFICEGVDQTRGWFYTLHALSVLLFDRPAYNHVISFGHILDENGEKMSKSKGNVVEPWSVLDHRGADALRWYMYSATAPGNPRRFSEDLVGDTVRRFLLPLWNTYSFFVTYANLDGFDPQSGTAPSAAERPLLDRWLLSSLQSLIATVTQNLESYNITEAARAIEKFVEELSSWYVRRSRRRFWKSEDDTDKRSAYHSLYETLTTLSLLLAPFTPFMADEMYRNLVAGNDTNAPESVHLASWPEAQTEIRDEMIEGDVRLAMRLSSLGRSARSKAQIKVRQPLAEALVLLPSAGERESLGRIADQLRDELNVKEIVAAEDETAFLQFSVRPNLARLGPRLGREMGAVAKVIQSLEGEDLAQVAGRARAGLSVEIAGTTLTSEDLLVESEDRAGYISTNESTTTIAIDTTVTAELAEEGFARDLVRHIQELRRTAGLEISDRITAFVHGDEYVSHVLERHGDYIRQETLALSLLSEQPGDGVATETVTLDDQQVTIGVEKVQGA